MGWRCIYTPHARGYHVRNVLPGNRRALPPVINMHSVKNRFLMRIKNMTGDLYRRNWFSITARDMVVLGCCLVREQQLAQSVLVHFAQNWKRVMAKRREIMSRKRVDDDYIASWFRYEPVSARRAKTQDIGARNGPRPKPRGGLDRRRASRFSAPAGFRRATADLRPSPKSFPRA